jgi:hypothetical protein
MGGGKYARVVVDGAKGCALRSAHLLKSAGQCTSDAGWKAKGDVAKVLTEKEQRDGAEVVSRRK